MSDRRAEVAGTSVSTEHYIGGRRVGSDETFEDRSPIDWSWKLADVARGDRETAAAAVSAAEAAAPAWGALTADERATHLHRLANAIDERVEQIAAVECADMGMLERSLRARVIARGAANLRNYADLAVEHEEPVWSSKGTANRVIRQPAGPAVIITPWNAPWMLATWKLAPALAAGNPVILKPAEWSPLSASLLADLADEVELPAGVLNVVQGIGEEVGAELVSDPRVCRISFTGSPEAGRQIGVAAARNLVPFTAELGGKGPFVVFDDADIDAAAKKAAGQYDDAGQVCLAGTRLLVHDSVIEEFLEAFHRYTDEQVLGDPREDATTISPLIHPRHLERVEGFVERARAAGDRVLRGGRRAEVGGSRDGLWFEPTLIEPASNDHEVVQHEVFGPVLTLQTFHTEDEAIGLANATDYGLSGVVYTSSRERAERVGRGVRAGTVWVNTFLVRDLTAPFGGMGISGIGREGGRFALEFHADLQTLQILEGSVE